jgi:hypothetical protein
MTSNDTTSHNIKFNGMASNLAAWLFGLVVLGIGVANLLLVHPVPAAAYALVSLVYFPPASAVLKDRFGISIHPVAKIALGLIVVMFTLGVSDLGDMID